MGVMLLQNVGQRITWRYYPEGHAPHSHRYENLKSNEVKQDFSLLGRTRLQMYLEKSQIPSVIRYVTPGGSVQE
jgi:hypothetical protein